MSPRFPSRRFVQSLVILTCAGFVLHAPDVRAQAEPEAPPTTRPGVTPPTVVTHVDAIYPPSALAERTHGDVVLAVTVDTDGHVSNVEVAQSGGAPFDEAAIVAVRQWTFEPALRGATPVASRIRVPFHFAPPAPPPEVVEEPPPAEPELTPQTAALPAPAPPDPSAKPPAKDPVYDIHVQGRHPPRSRGASDFNVPLGELARVPRENAAEMLKLAPGVLLTNEGGTGHAEQVFLRGFDAREGQDIEFTVDGVPINQSGNLHGNGHADTHFIIPELVHSLRVVEGPFDPRQGNYAVAGSADFDLALDQRGLTAKYTRGSFGTDRFLVLGAPSGESVHTFAGAEIYSSDGYGQNRQSKRGSAIGQYEGTFGSRGLYRITAQGYSVDYHSPGLIREDDYRAGRIGFYDTYDDQQGGTASRYSIAATLQTHAGNTALEQQFYVITNTMRLRENFTGYLLDVQEPIQNPHEQRGDLLDLVSTGTTIGARGAARFDAHEWGQHQELEIGYVARGDQVQGMQQRVEAQSRHPYLTETNLEATLGNIGLYGDVNLPFTKWLALRGGVRGELFTYVVNDLCAVHDVSRPSKAVPPGDASCLDQQNLGRHREPNQRASTASTSLLPRASLIAGPFANVTLSVSYGEGLRSIDPIYVTQDVPTPFATVRAYEGGAAYTGGLGADVALVARSVFFQTHVDRDLIFSETAGRNTLANGTTRTGWVGATRFTGGFFDESANLTLVRSTFDDTGLLVPYVPDVVLRSDTALFADLPLRLGGERTRGTFSTGLTYVGRRALPYGQRSDTIFTIDTSANLTWSYFELGISVTNLLDRRYRLGEYNFASDFRGDAGSTPTLVPMRHFTAGQPRAIFGTFAVHFGGGSK